MVYKLIMMQMMQFSYITPVFTKADFHTDSLHTCKGNFIYAHKQNAAFPSPRLTQIGQQMWKVRIEIYLRP
jgi:hypothetical protein